MVKKIKFWTPTKIIITILILSFLLFALFKLGLFEQISNNFLSTSRIVSINGQGASGGFP